MRHETSEYTTMSHYRSPKNNLKLAKTKQRLTPKDRTGFSLQLPTPLSTKRRKVSSSMFLALYSSIRSFALSVAVIPLLLALQTSTLIRCSSIRFLGRCKWNHACCCCAEDLSFTKPSSAIVTPHSLFTAGSRTRPSSEMGTWSLRAACVFLVFSLIVSERFGSCASINEEGRGRARSGLRNGAEYDAEVLALTIQGATQRRFLQARDQHDRPSSVHKSGENARSDQSSKPVVGVESSETSKSSTLPRWAIYALAIGGALLVAVVVTTSMYLVFTRRKKDYTVTPWSTGLSGPLSKAFLTGVPSLGRPELEAACEGFINVIGTSSDCTLYKGTLSSGVEIAVVSTLVNSSKDWSERSEEQLRNKISVLSRVNHKNFMNLLGYCRCDEPFTRMMVFEYAPWGSLFEHLHIREAEDLDWPTRLRIMMGVAYCLEHMSQLEPPVMPTTLSSSSIFLTEDYAAKISDIEFWKDDNEDVAAPRNSSSTSVVYKLGILLLEVISGRLPFSEDHGLLVLWASSYLDGKRPLAAMADPTLKSSVPEIDLAALCDVVRLCIHPEKGKRPAMAEVARMMRGVTALSPEQTSPRDNPLWWAELEIASSETG